MGILTDVSKTRISATVRSDGTKVRAHDRRRPASGPASATDPDVIAARTAAAAAAAETAGARTLTPHEFTPEHDDELDPGDCRICGSSATYCCGDCGDCHYCDVDTNG